MVDGIFGHPARVLLPGTGSLDELRQRINDADPFLWQAVISNERLDSYYTRMHESSLRNYAADLAAGVSFQNSHRHNELPIGRSLAGLFDEVSREVVGTFYTVRGLNLNGINTDHFIRGVETGILADVSIGFTGGDYRCSVCQRDMFDMECTHIPGLRYSGVEAFAWIEGARLAEVSSVYEGATPGATIIKAERAADAGWLKPEVARIIEERYRIKLPGARHAWPGAQVEEKDMEIQEILVRFPDLAKLEDQVEGVRTLADRFEAAERDLATVRGELTTERAKVAELEPLAADGRAYRADLVAEALVEGVRAHGDTFAKETYEGLLATAPIATVKRMRDDWRAVADKVFASGRATEDKTERQKPVETSVPDKAAFKS